MKPDLEDEAISSYDEQVRRRFNIENKLNQWLREMSIKEKDRLELEVRPEDSISRDGSRKHSRSDVSSASSSASSSEIRRVRAKQAVARLKMKQLKHQQELIKQEDEMKMRWEMLEAQNKIEQADLEAKIYEDDEDVETQRRNQRLASERKLNPDA